jgi:hypothetical protein
MEERLAVLAGLMRELEILTVRRVWLSDMCAAASADVAGLRKTSDAEQKDVDRLEGVSLTRVLVALRGARDDTLAREKAEAESARYRLLVAQDHLAGLTSSLAAVDDRLSRLSGIPGQYDAVLLEKENWIRTHGGVGAPALMQLAAARGRVEASLRSLSEAALLAAAARRALASAQRHLSAAGDWSAYDTFLGGGLLSSTFKHSRLDQAAGAVAQADRALGVLRSSLSDVGVSGPAGIRVDGLTRFTDIWFDNIFTDLAVRDRIKKGRRAVEGSLKSVVGVQRAVSRRAEEDRAELAQIAQARRDLLTR